MPEGIRPESISPWRKAETIGQQPIPEPTLGMMPLAPGSGLLNKTSSDIAYWLTMLARKKRDELMGGLPKLIYQQYNKLAYPEQPIPDVHPRSSNAR